MLTVYFIIAILFVLVAVAVAGAITMIRDKKRK